jgi:lipopolysaccharide/colanic/teichoic acid biosynthesis glycosyltransferase
MMNNSTKLPLTEDMEKSPAISSLETACRFAMYIGKGATVIHENMLEVNYAGVVADNLFSAQHTLMQLYQTHDLLPDVIICDFHVKTTELKSFLNFIKGHLALSTIPFLLLFNEKTNPKFDRQSLQNISGIDDVIFYDSHPEDIHRTIQFIKKFRTLKVNGVNKSVVKDISYHKSQVKKFLKRTFDIIISSAILLLLSPLFLLIAIAIRLDSKGSIFYISMRAGAGYKVFKFYKFRTMTMDADKKLDEFGNLNEYSFGEVKLNPFFIKVKNDPRVTRVGSFLRKTSLDELPQLINVLKGDMSLVGNRPLPLYEASTLTRDEWAERFLAPAGITGLWQVSKKGKKSMTVEERVNLDIKYANKNSFLYDIRIMASTPFAMIQNGDA